MSLKEIAASLNVCIGTIRRWQELRDVPQQYTFDLYRLLGKEIDYGSFSAAMKDQFFTPPDIAQKCWATFLAETGVVPADYTFIEPSAGDGSFMRVLPAGSICMDIEPRAAGIARQDYLQWRPAGTATTATRYIVFGNPPFGLRGHLALNFINHSYEFADYVCFILPQLFESDGKGSPRKRVVGYNLIYSETLSAPFYSPDAQKVKVNGVFQIWSKHRTSAKYQLATAAAGAAAASQMKVYSLSDGGTVATTRNKAMIGRCDIYLPSTCFGRENMRVYDSFAELPGKKGYGVVFLEDREAHIEKARSICWVTASFLSTNSAYNLRTSLIVANLISNE
jgi:hypothetical protein